MDNELPWSERITMLSIHPDAASRDHVARLASEYMEARRLLAEAVEGSDIIAEAAVLLYSKDE